MERIASFTVDHTVLVPGLYLSRRDGNVVTFDLRFKRPNTGQLLSNSQMHSVEHLIATLLRNSESRDAVIYFGPMGCQTGFYFLYDGDKLTGSQAIALLQAVSPGPPSTAAPCPAAPLPSAAIIKTSAWRRAGPVVPGIVTLLPPGRRKSSNIPQNKLKNFPKSVDRHPKVC